MTVRILCLDIEGGFGGSSRSLFESLSHLPPGFAPTVWCRRAGPIVDRYQAKRIPVESAPAMPRLSALPRLSRNIAASLQFARAWLASRRFRARLLEAAAQADLVHFNHEGLYILAAWLRRNSTVRITMHVRTMLLPGPFARLQCRSIAATVDGLVFITENERDSFKRHAEGAELPRHAVIYNIADTARLAQRYPRVPDDGRLVVASLSNMAWVRGTDRVIEIAAELKAIGRDDIVFVVAGEIALRGTYPGELGEIARRGGSLADFAAARGVADRVIFLGHVPEPEQVLAAADLLVKPTREDNPWGRDIIEALAAGKPVLSVGRYDRFVETGVTGILLEHYDARTMAIEIARLASDRPQISAMAVAARQRIGELCSGPARAADLAAFWSDVLGDVRDG